MEKIYRGRKYLRAGLNGLISSKVVQQVPPQKLQQTDSHVSFRLYRSTYSKANSQAFCKAETKTTSKKRYKAHQKVRQ